MLRNESTNVQGGLGSPAGNSEFSGPDIWFPRARPVAMPVSMPGPPGPGGYNR
jgi:hypothetical protein